MKLSKEKYYSNLPKKRAGAGALLFNDKNEVLILKPNYRDKWLLPGGVIENDESPRETVIREIREELNLNIKDLRLVCIDYKNKNGIKPDGYFFIFYGGILTKDEINKIKLQNEELTDAKFVNIKEAKKNLIAGISKRLTYCLKAIKNKRAFYLENGKII